jgi:hypothetical protein
MGRTYPNAWRYDRCGTSVVLTSYTEAFDPLAVSNRLIWMDGR